MPMRPSRGGYLSVGGIAGSIPELDGLRGIAILLVLLRHGARPVYESHGQILALGPWDIAIPLLNGWMGVDLFFVLSGFLITHHLLNSWPATFDYRFLLRYWSKRVLRTFPAYYATLFIVAAGVLPFYRPEVAHFGRELAHHLVFLQDYLGSQFVAAFWSLGVEEKFYLLCPFVLWWLGRYPQRRQPWILAGLALMPLGLRALTLAATAGGLDDYASFFWNVRSPFHLALDGLWLGVMCALLYRWRPPALAEGSPWRSRILYAGLAVTFATMLPLPWFESGAWWPTVFVLALVPLGFAGILLATITGATPLRRFLRAPSLRFLAAISYSVYLIHLPMLPLAEQLSAWMMAPATGPPLRQFAAFFPVFLALSLAAGLALHLTVEKPFLLLKDRIRLR